MEALGGIRSAPVRAWCRCNYRYSLKQIGQMLHQAHPVPEDFYGVSMSLSGAGDQIIVGAPHVNNSSGRVFIYTYSNSTDHWGEMALNATGAEDDYLGWSVALSGDGTALAVGAPQHHDSFPGYVNSYKFEADRWDLVKMLSSDDSFDSSFSDIKTDDFGCSVSLDYSGQTVTSGAPNSTASYGGNATGYTAVF